MQTSERSNKIIDPSITSNIDQPAHRQKSLVSRLQKIWLPWYRALRQTLPIYISIHVLFFIITCLSILFMVKDFTWQAQPLHTLWQLWNRKDSGHYIWLATHGYSDEWRTAFFPLYPLLIKFGTIFTHDAFIAALVISNFAGLLMLVTLYRIVERDFSKEQAERTILYISIFPTAFFFAAAYTESLFLCLIVLGFYHIQRGHWWLAGLCGLLASLTRSAGVLFAIPFLYEYMQQRHFNIKAVRANLLAGVLIPMGVALFALYCYIRFHDATAFSRFQTFVWGRKLQLPWHGLFLAFSSMLHSDTILSFRFLRNFLETFSLLFFLLLLALSFLGPWRFPAAQRSYALYATASLLFFLSFPVANTYPLESTMRYMLEIFPAFIVLAGIGKHRIFNLHYLVLTGALLFFMLTQFLTGHWIT